MLKTTLDNVQYVAVLILLKKKRTNNVRKTIFFKMKMSNVDLI